MDKWRDASIVGTGIAEPQSVSSRDIDRRIGRPLGWLEGACGVAARPVAGPDDTQDGMAVRAALDAYADADIDPRETDLILFAASVPRQPIPATAPLVKRGLGLEDLPCPAYDINATCLGWLAALDVAKMHIETGRAQTVLVVASEIASRALPWESDPATAGLFGDGAGAAVLRTGSASGGLRISTVNMETWSTGYEYCALRSGGTGIDYHADPQKFAENAYFSMDGPALFKLTRKVLPSFISALLSDQGWVPGEVTHVVPHQASAHGLEHMRQRCGFPKEAVSDYVRSHGNQVAASLPITLHRARAAGNLTSGARVLMVGTSAGVSLGGATLEVVPS